MIERGELRLPEMQRRYVWKKPRVRDLLDSLYQGYFPGLLEKAGAAAFDAQCIPIEAVLLDVEAYKAFLAKRRELIAVSVNAFLGTTPSPVAQS